MRFAHRHVRTDVSPYAPILPKYIPPDVLVSAVTPAPGLATRWPCKALGSAIPCRRRPRPPSRAVAATARRARAACGQSVEEAHVSSKTEVTRIVTNTWKKQISREAEKQVKNPLACGMWIRCEAAHGGVPSARRKTCL